mmetsp:Transcript_51621/g.112342  ORF Transcript_51621/g.112342 Transcript_51621/m.112342 type:complete len:614 (+) Transcript_51621:249-2090(+)
MSDEDRLLKLEADIAQLHAYMEQKAINIAGTADIFGRKFSVPVDAEHKATVFNFYALADCHNPHMRGFWAATFGFFSSFFSTFAAAPLMAYIKKPESLDLTKSDIGNSNIASVAGTIGMRLISGWLCEKFGARRAFFGILMLAVPGIIGIAFTQSASGFIICRFIIGLGLASFVTCQVWCSQLFNKSIVGAANATAGGWGNLGGGITNLVMPYIMLAFLNATDEDEDLSWRLCYIVPLAMHLLGGAFVLSGRDLPDGNFSELESSGAKQKAKSNVAVKLGISNINAWILLVTYGFCFGVELTMTNVAALYFYRYHGISPQKAGTFAACFGLMNLFARSWGGIISDTMNKRFGMRGRLWAMWIAQVTEGAFCVIMGLATIKYETPDSGLAKVISLFEHDGEKYSLLPSHEDYLVVGCGSVDIPAPGAFLLYPHPGGVPNASLAIEEGTSGYDLGKRVIVADILNDDCIRNNDLIGLVLFIMIMFSTCVQMAEGLHFGVVPYVSRPALGIVSGMVGAGGNAGAVLTLWTIFKQVDRTDTGFMILGGVIIGTSFLQWLIYFPDAGGMFFKAGSLNYDPQRIKPPEGYRGADALDYSNVTVGESKGEVSTTTQAAVA